ncbi:LOW QUALITY PROTEIN: hypothetical protein RJ639_016456 [Escallonia herrerae]|uniref:Uncharacterized protein n=1 Tax=Escallonia herrerae TaxID=1293975 RepID=A0AA88VBS9_9ASTE|nr:LOW QUALITY PROTEIN: hypothetical protein RJ639_016456 [Escallonia herrerae]
MSVKLGVFTGSQLSTGGWKAWYRAFSMRLYQYCAVDVLTLATLPHCVPKTHLLQVSKFQTLIAHFLGCSSEKTKKTSINTTISSIPMVETIADEPWRWSLANEEQERWWIKWSDYFMHVKGPTYDIPWFLLLFMVKEVQRGTRSKTTFFKEMLETCILNKTSVRNLTSCTPILSSRISTKQLRTRYNDVCKLLIKGTWLEPILGNAIASDAVSGSYREENKSVNRFRNKGFPKFKELWFVFADGTGKMQRHPHYRSILR